MTAPLLWGAFEPYWTVYHKVTFDGVNKLIYINANETSLDVETDIYSDWKEWAQIYDNLKFLPALRTTGGDPLPGGRRVGQYFFLINGWKLIPPLDNSLSDVELVGNLFSEDGSDIFASNNNGLRLIRQVVSQFTEIASPTINTEDITIVVSGSGLTAEESQKIDNILYLSADTTASIDTVLISQSLAFEELELQTLMLAQQSASLATQTQYLLLQSSSLVQLNSKIDTVVQNTSSGSLTAEQATMMLEMYRILGLDPTRPLIVTPTSRDAGAEISQTIDKTGDIVTVTRD